MKDIKLEVEYLVQIDGKQERILAVDGEKYFGQPGISHGFVHFLDPIDCKTNKGFCGTNWFQKNAKRV